MFKKLRHQSFNRFKENEAQIHELMYLFWECTLRCNLNCLHCGSDCSKDASIPDMPFEDFLNSITPLHNQYPKNSITVIFTGGEPLVRKDLAECGKKLRENAFRWGIVTNGIRYDKEKHVELLNAGMGSITLSVDGLEASHNWMRGSKIAFKKAISALELIGSNQRLNSDVVTCVNHKNFNELDQICDLVFQSGIKAWRLFTIIPIGRAINHKELFLSNNEMKELMEFIIKKRAKGLNVSFSCEGYTGAYEEKVRDGFFFCRAGIHIASVLADGSISACPNINHSFIQGNIYKDDFLDVWNNRFQDMRNRDWAKIGQCAECRDFKNCNGNGLHLWDEKRENVLTCHNQMIKDATN